MYRCETTFSHKIFVMADGWWLGIGSWNASFRLPIISTMRGVGVGGWGNSSEPAAVGGSGFQFLPLKKSGVDWNRYENHPISQLKNYAYLDENMPYPIQPISHYAAAYKFTIHTFYLAVAQDRHKPPGESGHVSLFTRSYACAALKISGRPLLS